MPYHAVSQRPITAAANTTNQLHCKPAAPERGEGLAFNSVPAGLGEATIRTMGDGEGTVGLGEGEELVDGEGSGD